MTYLIDPRKVPSTADWNQTAITGFVTQMTAVTLGVVYNLWLGGVILAKTAAWGLQHAWDYGYHPDPPNFAAQATHQPEFLAFALIIFFVTLGGLVLTHLSFREKHFGERGRGLAIAALTIGYLILILQVLSFLGRS